MCIFALKEIVDKYRIQNSTMFTCFIDASKAFDRINHEKLFYKMCHSGVPIYILRILVLWYAQQTMQVKWGNAVSTPFHVGSPAGWDFIPFSFQYVHG